MDPTTAAAAATNNNAANASATHKRSSKAPPKNTAIYISGLPLDTTVEEVAAFCSKCGIIMDEIATGKPRVKLYHCESNPDELKGDALVVYLREESVNLACTLLDESEFRPKGGGKISVQPAKWEASDAAAASAEDSSAKRTKVDKETWKRHMKRMQKKLEWFDEEAEAAAKEIAKRARWAKIVVLKNMYTPAELEADPLGFPVQLADEIIEECQERLGIDECSVQLVENEALPGGCTVKFKSELEAAAAVKLMDGRWFDGRRVEASIYDGSFALPKKTSTPAAVDEDQETRLEQFSRFIEEQGESESDNESESSEDDSLPIVQ